MKNRIVKFWHVASAILISSTLISSAVAQDLYAGLSIGSTEFDGSQFGDRNTALGLQVGLGLGQYFGIELSYTDYQEFDSRIRGQLLPAPKAIALSGLVTIPLFDRFEIFGKAGYAKVKVDIDSSIPFYVGSLDESNAIYGFGMNFLLSESWKIRIAYDRTELDLGNIPAGSFYVRSNGDLDLISAGLILDF